MQRVNNYLIQAQKARALFLTYNQQKLIDKLHLPNDETYLYPVFLGKQYRIHRTNGDISRLEKNVWIDGNTFEESLTLLDLLCDSKENRFLSGKLKNQLAFGHQFHQNLLEEERNPLAEAIQEKTQLFCEVCQSLGGTRIDLADLAYSFEVFDGLPLAILFWEGDEEFAPRVRFYWDENANMYIRYETMYYAVNLLTSWIMAEMK